MAFFKTVMISTAGSTALSLVVVSIALLAPCGDEVCEKGYDSSEAFIRGLGGGACLGLIFGLVLATFEAADECLRAMQEPADGRKLN